MQTDAWLQTDPETQSSPRVQSQKRVVRSRFLRKHALRTAEKNIQRKEVSFQLERITKKQKLLEAQKKLEQLKDDCPQKSSHQIPSPDAVIPGSQCRSRSTSCSSLSLQGLCLQHLPQLRRYGQLFSPRALAEVTTLLPRQCSLLPSASVSSVCTMERCVYSSPPHHLFFLLTPLSLLLRPS